MRHRRSRNEHRWSCRWSSGRHTAELQLVSSGMHTVELQLGSSSSKRYIRAVVAAGAAVMKIQWRCSRGSNEEEDAMALEQGAAAREIR